MDTGLYKLSKPKTSNHLFSCYTSLKFKRTTVLRSHNSGLNDSKMAASLLMISTMAQNFLCLLAGPTVHCHAALIYRSRAPQTTL